MPAILCILCLNALIIDSAVYSIDIKNRTAQQLPINEDIIDHCLTDYLYILTRRYLYKLNPENLNLLDRIPLPSRFNYLKVDRENIALISSNEIVTLQPANLSYKMGIGISYGDYHPILLRSGIIYLMVDTDKKSIIKKFDLRTGRLIKSLRISKVIQYLCDTINQKFITLDINNNLSIIDYNLRRKKIIRLKFGINGFVQLNYGYLLLNPKVLLSVNQNGRLIDFQPLFMEGYRFKNFFIYNKKELLYIDTLTLRVKSKIENRIYIKNLYPLNQVGYAVAEDREHNLYLLRNDSLSFLPLSTREIALIRINYPEPKTDSLWYIQLGAFRTPDYAQKMLEDYLSHGLPVFIDSSDLYRLKLGGFEQKRDAVAFIENSNIEGWFTPGKRPTRTEDIEFTINNQKYYLKNGIIKKGGNNEKSH